MERISDERLAHIKRRYANDTEEFLVICEAERSRALVAELRALAERMLKHEPPHDRVSLFRLGYGEATQHWQGEIDSLLAAHGSAHEVEVHLVASKEITKEDAEFICSVVDGISAAISEHGKQVRE